MPNQYSLEAVKKGMANYQTLSILEANDNPIKVTYEVTGW